jgi:hypothetical protein
MKRLSLLIGLLAVAGCAGGRQSVKAPVQAARILVLPPHAEGKAEQGAALVRGLATRMLAARGYVTVPPTIVDDELQKAGVTDPAQMNTTQLKAIAAATGADAAAVIDLTDFASVNRGFSYERRVAASVRLLDAQTGETIWQNAEQEVTKGSTRNPTKAVYDYVRQWSTEQFEKATKSPLYPEANALAEKLFKSLPAYSPA